MNSRRRLPGRRNGTMTPVHKRLYALENRLTRVYKECFEAQLDLGESQQEWVSQRTSWNLMGNQGLVT